MPIINAVGGMAIGSPVVSGTSGSVLFIDSSGKLAQNNTNLNWNNSTNSLTVGGSIAIVNSTNGTMIVQGNSGYSSLTFTSYRNSAITHTLFEGLAARGTSSVPLTITSGDSLFRFSGSGWDGTGFYTAGGDVSCEIDFVAAENFTTTLNHGGEIRLKTLVNGGNFKATRLTIQNDGKSKFDGSVIFGTDATYDIGASGATRPNNIYVANSLTLGGDLLFVTTNTSSIGSTGTRPLKVWVGTGGLDVNNGLFITAGTIDSPGDIRFANGGTSVDKYKFTSRSSGLGAFFVAGDNIWDQRNGTNNQFNRVSYYTDASNYNRLEIQVSGTSALIWNDTIGTYAGLSTLILRSQSYAAIDVGASSHVDIRFNTVNKYRFQNTGPVPNTDDTMAIGGTSNRWNKGWFGTGGINATGLITTTSGGNTLVVDPANSLVACSTGTFYVGDGNNTVQLCGSQTYFRTTPASGIYAGWTPTSTALVLNLSNTGNTLEQRNGTNAQTWNLYDTYTDASNYRRVTQNFQSGYVYLTPNAAGTGVAALNGLVVGMLAVNTALFLDAGTTTYFRFSAGGNYTLDTNSFLPSTNDTRSIGSTSFRFNKGWFGTGGIDLTGPITDSYAGAASTAVITLNGALLTGGTATTNFPQYLAQPTGATAVTTWSTTGTFIGINAATGFTGNFLDFHLNGGTSVFKVDYLGNLTLSAAASSTITTAAGYLIVASFTNQVWLGSVGGLGARDALTLGLASNAVISWTNGASNFYSSTIDLTLLRDASNTLAQRNSTNAQASRIYRTYTDVPNNAYGEFTWSSNNFVVQSVGNGTGTVGNLILRANSAGGASLTVPSSGGTVSSSGGFSTMNTGFQITAVGGNGFWTNGGGYAIFQADGVFELSNSTYNGFTRIVFGVNGNVAYPSLTRNGTGLDLTLGDGTGNGSFKCLNIGLGTAATTTSFTSIAAGTTAKSQIFFTTSTAPTSPSDGDFWFDGTSLKIRQGGATVALGAGGGGDVYLANNQTFTGANTFSRNGAVSSSSINITGTIYSAGTATTNFPLVYFNTSGATAPTTLSTAGTALGFNLATGFAGNFLDFHINGGASVGNWNADGTLKVNYTDGTLRAQLGILSGSTGFGALYLGSGAPSSTNYTLAQSTSILYINAVGTNISYAIAGSVYAVMTTTDFRLATTQYYGVGSGASDVILRRVAAANWAFGDQDAAAPVAQTLSVQNVVTGTSNTAGVDWTFKASSSTGTGAGGSFIFRTTPAGSTGSTPNTFYDTLKIASDGTMTLLDTGGTYNCLMGPMSTGLPGIWIGRKDVPTRKYITLGGGNLAGGGQAGISQVSSNLICWSSSGTDASTSLDTYIRRGGAAATVSFGLQDAAAPVAQTLSVQNVVTGTSNTAGVNLTVKGSSGTGTGNPGDIIFQSAWSTTTGSTPNSYFDHLKLDGTNRALIIGGKLTGTGNYTMRAGQDASSQAMLIFGENASANSRFAMCANSGFVLATAQAISWGTIATTSGTITNNDLWLWRDAAGILAQRNGTNAQASRIYRTYTDTSNHTYLQNTWSSNNAVIETIGLGTGTVGDLILRANSTSGASLTLANGSTGATFNGSVTLTAGALVLSNGGLSLVSGNSVVWNACSRLKSSSDGLNNFTNNASSGFTALTLGLETTAFPALCPTGSSGNLELKDGTRAGFTNFKAASFESSVSLSAGTTLSTATFLNVAAGTTAKSQLNLASSTAPTSPVNGDIWFDGTDIKMRIGGVTKTFTLI